ncbi:MAG: TrkH family potassium uptake protein, partial [Bacteroidales bacterium]|nr:TrkH family potassium uptake protein [Bacteroidales bacterium]
MLNINFKAIAKIIGVLLCIEAIFMLFPLFTSIYYHEKDTLPFLFSFIITLITGAILLITSHKNIDRTGKREGFMAVALSWISISIMGALPFIFNGDTHTFTDAFFESMSGFSTTGMSILEDIDGSCHGILLWRSLSQWLGGMGIILFSLAIMPILNNGSGLYLFSAEMTGVTHEKLGPRISQTAKKLWGLYLFFTILLFILLVIGPMDTFDAICTAMTTYSAGGFSTKQASIAYWNSAYIDYVITFFMFLSGINFALIYRSVFRNPKHLFQNEELKYYVIFIILGTIIITAYLLFSYSDSADYEWSFRTALFTVVSGLTTTGYSIVDFCDWGSFFFFFICLY